MKKIRFVCGLIILHMLVVMLTAFPAFAGSKADEISKKTTLPLSKGGYYRIWKLDKGGKIEKESIKVSKTSVLRVRKVSSEGTPVLLLTPVKKGTAKLSFKYTYQGETKKYKFTIRVVKYTKPFKTFKIGEQNFAKSFKKSVLDKYTPTRPEGTIQVTPAKGWRCKYILFTARQEDNTNYYQKYNPGTSVKIPYNGQVDVLMHNTVYNYDQWFTVIYQ